MNHAKLIRSNYIDLIDMLDCQHMLLGHLWADDAISYSEWQDITSQETSLRQTQKLLSLIAMKPKETFERFLAALNSTGQTHVSRKLTDNSTTGKHMLLR